MPMTAAAGHELPPAWAEKSPGGAADSDEAFDDKAAARHNLPPTWAETSPSEAGD